MKIIFAGTPEYSAHILNVLLKTTHTICAVYTRTDQPAGRGQKLTASPVKQIALQNHLPVYQPVTLRDPQTQEQLRNFAADIIIVVAYGMILPKAVLDLCPYGCINVHPSLLPRWRGAAPIQRAIAAGDSETGVTIMQMNEQLDAGDILKQKRCEITTLDTAGSLHDRLADIGAEILIDALADIENQRIKPIVQDESLVTYAHKISKLECRIDWNQPAELIGYKIRAFNPWPIAYTEFNTQILRIWQAQVVEQIVTELPGTIINFDKNGIDVATSDQILRLQQLQLAGGKILNAADFINARKAELVTGVTRFG